MLRKTKRHPWEKPLRTATAALAMLLCSAALAWGQEAQLGSLKLGMTRLITSGATYSVEDTAGTISGSHSGPMSRNDVFVEYILFGRLGIEASTSLSYARRSYELEDSSATLLANVEESGRATMFGLNLYFADHQKVGLKYYFGLSTGQVYVTRDLSGSGTLAAFSGRYQEGVPVDTLKFGIDWMLEKAGLRLQLISQSGSETDRTSLAGYNQVVSYDATIVAIGAFGFF